MKLLDGSSLVFFFLFAVVQVVTYLAIRRQWGRPVAVAVGCVLLSIITMVLTSLGQNNAIIQAIIVGIVIGTVFSGATLAIAWYFHSSELRAEYAHRAMLYTQEEAPPDDGV